MEGEADVENSKLVGLGTTSEEQQAQQAQQAQSVGVLMLPTSTVTTTPCRGNGKKWTTMNASVVPFVVMTLVQGLYASHQVLAKVALGSGLDPLFYTVSRNVVAFLFLAPAAFFLERDTRPKMTMSTFGSLNLLAFFGILGNQQMFLAGLALTTPLFTAVVQNMVPVITFLLAALLGMEKISFRKRSDQVRMLGTVTCIGGAVTMSIYKGIAIYTKRITDQGKVHGLVHMSTAMPAIDLQRNSGQWFVGVLCLLLNCTSWGLYLVNQGSVLQKYPALLSMAAIMELLGSVQVAIVGVAYEGFRCLDLRLITMDQFIIILYGVRSNSELKQLLIQTTNKSVIVIEDIDCSVCLAHPRSTSPRRLPSSSDNEAEQGNDGGRITLSGLLNFTDGLWSCCGNERILIFTTNHIEKLDAALLRPGRMDLHIHMSYCTFAAFQTLALNYLMIESHFLFPKVEKLLRCTGVKVTPAQVSEILIQRRGSVNDAMASVVAFLEGRGFTSGKVHPHALAH